MLAVSGHQSAVGGVVCRLFACLADRDDSPFRVICEQPELFNSTILVNCVIFLLVDTFLLVGSNV